MFDFLLKILNVSANYSVLYQDNVVVILAKKLVKCLNLLFIIIENRMLVFCKKVFFFKRKKLWL